MDLNGVLPAPTDAVDGHHHQGIAAGQASVVQTVPSTALLGAGGARDADVAEHVLPGGHQPSGAASSWDSGSIPGTPSWSRRLVRMYP